MRMLIAALALLTSAPAFAQSGDTDKVADTYDSGDWWWLDVSGNQSPRKSLLLVNGEVVRKGDVVEIEAFTVYREPDPTGVLGGRIRSRIDCKANTDSSAVHTIFYSDNRMREISAYTEGATPLSPETVYFRFACNGERSHAYHVGKGSRRAIAAGIFAVHPLR